MSLSLAPYTFGTLTRSHCLVDELFFFYCYCFIDINIMMCLYLKNTHTHTKNKQTNKHIVTCLCYIFKPWLHSSLKFSYICIFIFYLELFKWLKKINHFNWQDMMSLQTMKTRIWNNYSVLYAPVINVRLSFLRDLIWLIDSYYFSNYLFVGSQIKIMGIMIDIMFINLKIFWE